MFDSLKTVCVRTDIAHITYEMRTINKTNKTF
jgi:hypothetical protein